MRRALILLVLATPASVLAQAEGEISFSPLLDEGINIAQCSGVQNEVRGGDDELTVDITWNIRVKDGESFSTGGDYRVFAASKPLKTSEGIACEFVDEIGTRAQVGDDYDVTERVFTAQDVSLRDIANAAGFGSCDSGSTIYLCVQWVDTANGNEVNGWATTNINLDLSRPTPPTGVSASSGDRALRVSCSGDGDKDAYKARAVSTNPADPQPHWSGESDDCAGLRIGGLTNEQDYTVVVFGLDDARNPSEPSAAVTGRPIPTDDFWEHYDGAEQGGCNTAAGAAGLLAALSILAALAAARRRKP